MSPEAEIFWEKWHDNFRDNLGKIENQLGKPYGWNEFDPLRKEIAQSLLSGLYLAAITSTNLLVELFLKVILIYHDVSSTNNYCITETDRFTEPLDKYSSEPLHSTISSALDKWLITSEEERQLRNWKEKFRNPYSHANIKQIIDNYPNMIGLTGHRLVSESKRKACEYFIAVDTLIRDVTSRNFDVHPGTGRNF